MMITTNEILDFKENMIDFNKRIAELVPQVKYADDIGSVIEYSSDAGVLFTVEIMDEDGEYLFNFGDVTFVVNEEAFAMIKEKMDAN